MELHERLKWARAKRFKTPTDAARALNGGSNKGTSTYLAHENGTTPPPRDASIRYAKFFRVNLEWLLTEKGSPGGGDVEVPIVGYVGAGPAIVEQDPGPGGRYDTILAPSDLPADSVAVTIKGDSMHPFEDGWVLFYRKAQDGVPVDCVNKLCVVHTQEGHTFVKTLLRGRSPKLWTLSSYNAKPQEDVRLDWAARVLLIRPR